jgi:hypothetical protein
MVETGLCVCQGEPFIKATFVSSVLQVNQVLWPQHGAPSFERSNAKESRET